VVSGSEEIRDVLVPVYGALGIAWDPSTVGAVEDEDPSLGWGDVAEAILLAFGRRYRLVEGELGPATLERADAARSRFELGG
jgi:hypothetical protein